MSGIEFWAGTDMIYDCLVDAKRVKAFKEAIEKAVIKDKSVVVDLGSGTGILSLFALQAGAKKVYSIEADPSVIPLLKSNLKKSKHADRSILIKGDATKIDLPEKVDVVICEMVATGLIDELQVPAINNVLKFCKKDTIIVPQRIKNFVELVEAKNVFYGHRMSIIQYEYPWYKKLKSKSLSEKVLYLDCDFSKQNEEEVDFYAKVSASKSGIINAIRISNETLFNSKKKFLFSNAYCIPLVLPLEPTRAKKGEEFTVHIKYKLCKGHENLKYSVERVN